MKHKIEAIDYLRGSSILILVLLHIIIPTFNSPPTIYSSIPSLFKFRDILNFCVVTIILCSGFSLYLSASNLKFTLKAILTFYKKRLKRLLFPWWSFLSVGFIIYGAIGLLFDIELEYFKMKYIISSYLLFGGVPASWIVLVMVVLTLLFPFLKKIYDKSSWISVSALSLLYILSTIASIKFPVYIYETSSVSLSFISITSFISSFVIGWSLVYLLGFFLERLYNTKKLMKKELNITFNFILLFIFTHVIYKLLGLNTYLYSNKWPPSPYYVFFGIAMTFLLLNLFFAYKHFIHTRLKGILAFFSFNSYWLFLWSLLALVTVGQFRSFIEINVYFKLILEYLISLILITLLVILQKKIIKIEMHFERHHF